jgi:hypothetical protein
MAQADDWKTLAQGLATAVCALWQAEAAYTAKTGKTHATLRECTRAACQVEEALAAFDRKAKTLAGRRSARTMP